jgi:prevent-host-death family protein
MKKVSEHRANREFSELLSHVERGEEILITKRYCALIARRG